MGGPRLRGRRAGRSDVIVKHGSLCRVAVRMSCRESAWRRPAAACRVANELPDPWFVLGEAGAPAAPVPSAVFAGVAQLDSARSVSVAVSLSCTGACRRWVRGVVPAGLAADGNLRDRKPARNHSEENCADFRGVTQCGPPLKQLVRRQVFAFDVSLFRACCSGTGAATPQLIPNTMMMEPCPITAPGR